MVVLHEQGWLGADGVYYGSAEEAHESYWEKQGWKRSHKQSTVQRWEEPYQKPAVEKAVEPLIEPLHVFLCHASEDTPRITELYSRLISAGIDVWLDKKKLFPGQNWKQEITKAIKKADVVIACLSKKAVNKQGYVHREIKEALDAADNQPEGVIFLIPLRFEDCEIPLRLQDLHYANYYEENGYELLVAALSSRAAWLGKPQPILV